MNAKSVLFKQNALVPLRRRIHVMILLLTNEQLIYLMHHSPAIVGHGDLGSDSEGFTLSYLAVEAKRPW